MDTEDAVDTIDSTDFVDLSALTDLDTLDRNLVELQQVEHDLGLLEKRKKELREKILNQMNALKQEEMESTHARIKVVRAQRVKVDIAPQALPEFYQIVAADTDRIKEALKRGIQIEGCYFEESESLRFKWH